MIKTIRAIKSNCKSLLIAEEKFVIKEQSVYRDNCTSAWWPTRLHAIPCQRLFAINEVLLGYFSHMNLRLMMCSVVLNPAWVRGYKILSCSTQLSMKFFLLINVKMPTIVGILTFMSRKNSILGWSEPGKSWISRYFFTYGHLKFHAQLSWAWKKFYNLGAWSPTFISAVNDNTDKIWFYIIRLSKKLQWKKYATFISPPS